MTISKETLKYNAITAFSQEEGAADFPGFVITADTGWLDLPSNNREGSKTQFRTFNITRGRNEEYYTIVGQRHRNYETHPWVLDCNFQIG